MTLTHSAWRLVLPLTVLAAAAFALATPPGPTDFDLGMLLRFMAVVKAGMALGAAALIAWRMGTPVRPAVAAGYVTATAAMAGGAGLIWQLAHIGAGAALVHGGLLALLAIGWRDRAGWDRAASALSRSVRFSRSVRPGVAIRTPSRGASFQQRRSPPIGSETSSSPAGPSL